MPRPNTYMRTPSQMRRRHCVLCGKLTYLRIKGTGQACCSDCVENTREKE